MKKLILSVLCISTSFLSYAQVPSSCSVPTGLYNSYKAEVRQMAIQRINQINSTYKDSIEVPLIYQDTIWNGLAAIFNSSTPQSDSVFSLYCIHQYPNAVTTSYGVIVVVDTSFSWTMQWQALQTITGYADLDSLLTRFGLTVTNYLPSMNIAILHTSQEINIQNLRYKLITLNGITATNAEVSVGAGDNLSYSADSSNRNYNFTIGYGDCPSGCLAYYTMKFHVHADCSVDYLGVVDFNPGNEPFPFPTPCSITTNIGPHFGQTDQFINVYPNPTSEYINISSTSEQIVNFKLFDVTGRILKTGTINKSTVVSLTDLSSGIYFIDFVDRSNNLRHYVKIIKD